MLGRYPSAISGLSRAIVIVVFNHPSIHRVSVVLSRTY